MIPLVLNIFSAPCAGKSTCALYVTANLKMRSIHAEYIPEYAKECVWENRLTTVENQPYVFAKQYHRLLLASKHNGIEVCVLDSPVLQSLVYSHDPETDHALGTLVIDCFDKFNNLNVFLERPNDRGYTEMGRFQNEDEACEIGAHIEFVLTQRKVPYEKCESVKESYDMLVSEIESTVLRLRKGL